MTMQTIKDIINDPLKGKNHAQNILSYLFRELLLWRKVNLRVWNKRVEEFFLKPHNKDYQDRGNFNKALKSNTMQWTSFKRAIDVLSPTKAMLTLKLTFKDKVETFNIILDPTEPDNELTVNSFPWENCDIFKNSEPADNLLAHLTRHIFYTRAKESKDQVKWFEDTIETFLKEPRNVLGFNRKELTVFQNTLKNDVLDARLSWNKLRRAIYLLMPLKEEYELHLSWTDNPELKKRLPDTLINIEIVDPHLN